MRSRLSLSPDAAAGPASNMFGDCHGFFWDYDDFSECFLNDYIRTLFPLILCGVSLLILLVAIIRSAYTSKYYHAYSLLNSLNPWDFKTAPQLGNGHLPSDYQSFDEHGDDEVARNVDLVTRPALQRIATNATNTTLERSAPKGQNVSVVIEVLALLAELALGVVTLRTRALGRNGQIAAAANIAVWAYILALAVARLFLSLLGKHSPLKLWYHTATLYGLQWLLAVLVFRSDIINPPSKHAQSLTIAQWSVLTVLVFIALGSRKGNRMVELEYEDDILPSHERTASVLSLATFFWVDRIVWSGFKKTLEIQDVWNLIPKDKAANVLAQYRQVKRTNSLAWHLVKYFKGALLIQGAWAAALGLICFVPTLLLRSILRYLEDPDSVPKSTAWSCVALLLVHGGIAALTGGQAFWLGRRTGVRLRAITVGEVYAKALKRKAGVTGDKVLGEEKKQKGPEVKRNWIDKIKIFAGRMRQSKGSDGRKSGDDGDESSDSNSNVSGGTIINLMAVDSFKVSEICAYIHFLWAITPVQFILAIVLLYQALGNSSIAGIGAMIAILPLNLWIAKQFSAVQVKILAATDARIHTTNEVLTNIRIIKYFAWEQRFIETVEVKRKAELQQLWKRYLLWSLAATLWGTTPIIITLLTFALYTMVEHKALIPSVAFPALALFQILRMPLDQLADMVAGVQEAKVSIDRIQEFLSEEDTPKYKQLRHHDSDVSDDRVGFMDGHFTWDTKGSSKNNTAQAFRLMDLNIAFAKDQLNVIAGPTGSGKTSLLLALLGEMTLLSGNVYLPGATSREDLPEDPHTGLAECVAYCAQQAWLVSDTVKQNIIFASPWNEKRYNDVVKACSLEKDFQILDHGDQTQIGEKGVTLSGGQKQRISLARAMYCNARYLLLDDILSAVDSHTARWIFEKAIMGPMMHGRTCILVTHNVSLCLPYAEFAVYIDNGKIKAQGSVADIIHAGVLTTEVAESAAPSKAPSPAPSAHQAGPADMAQNIEVEVTSSTVGMNGHIEPDKKNVPNGGPAQASLPDRKTGQEESKAEGSVKLGTIAMYLRSMGGFVFWSLAASSFAAQQLSSVSTNVWIRTWANAYAAQERRVVHTLPIVKNASPGPSMSSFFTSLPLYANNVSDISPGNFASSMSEDYHVDEKYYLTVYGLLGIVYISITFARFILTFWGSLSASKLLHTKLITAISHAKFHFFDVTPLGQMMNRFSKDIESIDQEVAPVAEGVIHCFASIITIVILISVITPSFLIPGVFITLIFLAIGKLYINGSRDLKRLESVQRSPLYQQFGETLSGMVTIRAYGDERRFLRDNLNKINNHARPFIYLWATNRWLAFRVDVAGALVSFFSAVFVVTNVGKIDPGAAGLSMTYAVTFTESMLWFVRLYGTNEQNMNSVERIKEYLDVEQEAPAIKPDSRPPADWPNKGAVEFRKYSTRYRSDFDLVLKNLTFKINPCEKIGVVGRTGAGKSSLALALFRALEAETGSIIVDGIDIGEIGLHDLREAIVMVPQDPTLFSGTIRSNLDPFGLFTDQEIFAALRRVQLIGSDVFADNAEPARPVTPPLPSELPINQSTDTEGTKLTTGSANDSSTIRPSSSTATTAVAEPQLAMTENRNVFLDLQSSVSESGSNLSQGQRQLLCLARALLKSPKVLLMDEATASIDYATDAKIQETIRELKDNTIITIAHRLKTIVDYDRVVVMERGEVVEIGAPWDLIRPMEDAEAEASGKRWFREMCVMSGEIEVLEREAKKSWDSKRLVDDSA